MSKKNTYYVSSIKIIDEKNPEKEKSITLKSWQTCLELKWSQSSWKAKGRLFAIIFIILFSVIIWGLIYLHLFISSGLPENTSYKLVDKFLLPLAILGISLTPTIKYEGEEEDSLWMLIIFILILLIAIWLVIYLFFF